MSSADPFNFEQYNILSYNTDLFPLLPKHVSITSFLCPDVNTAPIIDNLPATINVLESTGGNTVIFTLSVTEPDGGDSTTITYVVTPSVYTAKFTLNSRSILFSCRFYL